MSSSSDGQVDRLIDALVEGVISDEQMAAADRLLATDPEARRRYVEQIGLVSALEFEKLSRPPQRSSPPVCVSSSASKRALIAALLACAVLVVSLTRQIAPQVGRHPQEEFLPAAAAPDEADSPLARLAAGYDHRFLGERQPAAGDFGPGTYYLAEGAISLRFSNGVLLSLESPAEFELVHAKRVVLHRGTARVQVPESGQGFVIAAPDLDIEDLGTEFGVIVDDDRSTTVHVFTGEVELQRAGQQPVRFTEGTSAQFKGGHELAPGFLDLVRFPTSAGIGFRQWSRLSQQLRNDPSAVFYYDFERDPGSPDLLRDRSGSGATVDGVVRGGYWVSGRWPGKGALLFENDGDAVDVEIPGEFKSFTLHVWLRVNRLEFSRQAILSTRGWDPGEHSWQILGTAELTAGINGVYSGRRAGRVPIGRWLHLAAVVDRKRQSATYYLDGEPTITVPLPTDDPVSFGQSIIGGFTLNADDPWPYDRQFRGWIDEFALFDRAFSPAEIREMYLQGSGFE